MERKSFEERKKIILKLMEDSLYVPMKEKELALILQVQEADREELCRILEELLREGRIMLTKKGRYQLCEGQLVNGTFISNAKGFGFVEVEGQPEDYYVPEDKVHGAFHMDLVTVRLLPGKRGKRTEAEVVSVVKRGITRVVGTYEKSKNFGFVVPDDSHICEDIFVPKERSKGAVDGHKVVVEITDYGKEADGQNKFHGSRNPEGKIVEILGHINDPGVDILSVIRGFELPLEYPEKVLTQAERVAKEVSDADRAGRRDLRALPMVTIDGEDAKDLDDAVSLTIEKDGYHLGVHIADVTNYVQENSALDKEAYKRGTSVYLVDRVIPMLPHVLSNGMCSLNAGEDRLALSCLMTVNKKGEITDYEIVESVICVDRRMSYTSVKKILEKDPEETDKYKELVPIFFEMNQVAGLLREKRRKRGSIDFDFPESKIYLDQNGVPTRILPYERNAATRMIEDFMLAANETVAEHFYWQEIPFVYRTHDTPDAEKIEKLCTFINNFGYHMKKLGKNGGKISGEEVHPKEIQKLLDKIAGTPEEAMISRLTLRSMKRAQYSVVSSGHFGLACPYYCHFTSPIRRYPDLQIHRIIKEQLRGKLGAERIEHYKMILPEVAKHTSETERRADEAERETDKLKKVEYMESRVGKEYQGVISGITKWGIYVELPNTVEGLLHVSRLPGDYFYYREETYEMIGEATGKVFKLGDVLTVRVLGTDRQQKSIDFALVDENDEVNWEDYLSRELEE